MTREVDKAHVSTFDSGPAAVTGLAPRARPKAKAGSFLHVVYPAGSESAPAEEMQRHAGREWGYVISGTLHVTIEFDDYVMEPSDAVSFDSTDRKSVV